MALPMAGILTTVIAYFLGQAIVRMLLGAGLALVIYQGVDIYVGGFLDSMASAMSGLPADMLAILTIAGIPEALNIIGSVLMTVVGIRLAARVVGIKLGSN